MIEFQLSKEATRIWDLHVPILQAEGSKDTHVYLTEGIDEPSEYNELCYRLSAAEADETFHFYLNTPGGMIDSAFMVVDSMKQTKAKIIGHLSGTVASAGTIIALACDELVSANHVSFMIHNYSAGMSGKGHEMKARQEFMEKSLNDAFKTFYLGFLTEDEIQAIINGKDFWIDKTEVMERWDNRVQYLKGTTATAKVK